MSYPPVPPMPPMPLSVPPQVPPPPGFGMTSPSSYALPPKTSGLAVASLVCSIIFCCPLTALLGSILGFAALPGIRSGRAKGMGLAIAGIVIGLMGLLIATPFEVLGGIKIWGFAQTQMQVAPEQYVKAVAAGDSPAAARMSSSTWAAHVDDLKDELSGHGDNPTFQRIGFHLGGDPVAPIAMDLQVTFSDGHIVKLRFLMFQNPGTNTFTIHHVEKLP